MSSSYGEWPREDARRCDGCRFAEPVGRRKTPAGCERPVWRCARLAEHVHETQAEAHCNYWEVRS